MKFILISLISITLLGRESCKETTTPADKDTIDITVAWEEETQNLLKIWRSDTVSRKSSQARNPLAEIFDKDSSILIGLSMEQILLHLGPSEGPKDKIQYYFDKYWDEEGTYLGCWLDIIFDEKNAVTDVHRLCF